MILKLIRFFLATAVALTLTGCVQRTVYRHAGTSSGGNSSKATKQRPSSSEFHWFWEKDFWDSK